MLEMKIIFKHKGREISANVTKKVEKKGVESNLEFPSVQNIQKIIFTFTWNGGEVAIPSER